jgi:nucleotide-binding universal stress UspA family protein
MARNVELILVATDFSRSAALATRRAAQLARAAGARLELMHVIPPEPVLTGWTAFRGALAAEPATARAEAMTQLRWAAARIDAELSVTADMHLAEGRAHIEIARRAAEIKPDLVVLGAHGEHFVLDVFVGTTAQRVQRRSSAPVLVVRQAPYGGYERVLIATDFSPASANAARTASRFFSGAMFHMLNVYQPLFQSRLAIAGMDGPAIEEYQRRAGDHALRELESFAREAAFEDRPSLSVRHGYAPARIKERAVEIDADVIVLGTEGKSRLEAGFLGSVSEHVAAESHCDVLLVRPSG